MLCNCLPSAPNDYHNTTRQLTIFTHGRMCINIPIINDDIPERDERFSVIVTSNHPQVRFLQGRFISRDHAITSIAISDDDGKPFSTLRMKALLYYFTLYLYIVTRLHNYVSHVFCFVSHPECSSLTNPDNGRVTLTGTNFGSQATYSCNFGYVLNGPLTRVCQADGWSGNDTICESRDLCSV